jgi:signal transduction histidine kinase
MQNSKTNSTSNLSRDYFIFLTVTISCLILCCIIMSYIIYSTQEKKRQEQTKIQLSVVSRELTKSFGNVENFLQFIGDRFVNTNQKDIEAYAKLFQHNYTIDSNFQNIYLSTYINWVNREGKIAITANNGLLTKPIEVPGYYPLKTSLTKPWELITAKIQNDQKGYFLPVSMSVFDDNNVYMGSIAADIIIDSLQRELNLTIINKDIEFIIVDRDQNILLSSTKNDFFSKINFSYLEKDNTTEYKEFSIPIKFGDIIYTAYKRSSLGFVIIAGYSITKEKDKFFLEITPYIYSAFVLTLIFLILSYLFRNVTILPLIAKLRSNLRSEIEARVLNEQMLSRILKNIPGFVYRHRICNDDVLVEYISPGCMDLTGYRSEQYLSETNPINYTDIIDPAYVRKVLDAILLAIEKGESYEISYPIITSQGQEKWVLNQGTHIKPNESNPGYLIEGMLTDITHLKNAEYAMQKMLKELEMSNAELEKFAYICSHDLKEPLRTIFSYIQLVKKDRNFKLLSSTSLKYIAITEHASLRMKNLIENILLYSKVGTQPVKIENIDINQIILDIKESLSFLIHETNAKIIVQKDLPIVIGDTDQIRRLLQNLLSNSLKFYKKNTPPKIEIGKIITNTDEVIFYVKDNGIGIDKKYCNTVFDLFARLQTHDEFPGTGIGLSICKKIVERHGGKIWVQLNQRKGTKICFTLTSQKANHLSNPFPLNL